MEIFSEGHNFSAHWFDANLWQFEKQTEDLGDEEYRILEIGSYEGRSTCWLLHRFPRANITCVDICEQPVFWPNIKASRGDNRVTMRVGLSRDVLPSLPHSAFDIVYVDGSHSTIDVLEDAVYSFRLAKPGALIGFDDYKWRDKRFSRDGTPKKAIDAFLKVYRSKVSVRSRNYQVWINKTED